MKIVLHRAPIKTVDDAQGAGQSGALVHSTPFVPDAHGAPNEGRTLESKAEPGPNASLFELQLRGRGPSRAELLAFFQRFGMPLEDPTVTGLVDRLAAIDGQLAARFLKRVASIRQLEAERLLVSMRISIGRQEGSFHDDPERYIEVVLAKKANTVKPAWRRLGAVPPAELPGFPAKVEAALESMFGAGFGYISAVPDPALRDARVKAGRDAFLLAFGQMEPELRGELLAKLDVWPPYQLKWLVQEGVMIAMREDDVAREITPDQIANYEARWRKELERDLKLLRFLDASRYEPVGSFHLQKDLDDPALIAASLALLPKRSARGAEYIASHVRYALEVLCGTNAAVPAINRALRSYASSGGEGRWRAVLGLARRGADDPPWGVLIKAAHDRHEQGTVLLELRALHAEGRIDRVPDNVIAEIRAGFERYLPELESYPAGWIGYGQLDTIPFLRRIGLTGPQIEAAIAAAAAKA